MIVKHFLSSFVRQFAGVKTVQILESNRVQIRALLLSYWMTLSGFPGGSLIVKNLPTMRETWFNPWVRRSPGGGYVNPLQCSCLGNPMNRGGWTMDSPWGHKKLDTTEQLTLSLSLECIY